MTRKNDISLRVGLGRLKLENPVLTASGTFGYGEEYTPYTDLNRLGGIVTKAITLKPRDGNRPPRVMETASGMLNSIGLANVGVDVFIRDKIPFLRTLKTRVVVNVAGSTLDDYREVVRRLDRVRGIAALEVNISCPNVKQGGMAFGADAKSAARTVAALRQLTKRYLIVKLSPNVTDIAGIACAVEDAGADALTVINTLSGMAVDARKRTPRLANIFGGLSGPAIKPVALACVYKVCARAGIPVIGGGGIMNAEDAVEFLLCGARAVQIGTGNFADPDIAAKTAAGLRRFCREEGIARVTDLIGGLRC